MNRNETKEKSHPEDGLMHLDDIEIVDFGLLEDTIDTMSVNMHYLFKDRNNDTLTFRVEGQNHIKVTIYQQNGTVIIAPELNWNGKETLTFYANDSVFEISQEITITITPINDPPGPIEIIKPQNGLIIFEGDLLDFSAKCSDPDLPYGDNLSFQ